MKRYPQQWIPPSSFVKVEVGIRLDIAAMQARLTPEQRRAVIEGIGHVLTDARARFGEETDG